MKIVHPGNSVTACEAFEIQGQKRNHEGKKIHYAQGNTRRCRTMEGRGQEQSKY